mmetsp:Transcript_49874/g.89648  ORF Transcript_49874/g.89648 Transcript_49874/m.89648 type:complete len:211 (-) Transcript_49874:9-641(-)
MSFIVSFGSESGGARGFDFAAAGTPSLATAFSVSAGTWSIIMISAFSASLCLVSDAAASSGRVDALSLSLKVVRAALASDFDLRWKLVFSTKTLPAGLANVTGGGSPPFLASFSALLAAFSSASSLLNRAARSWGLSLYSTQVVPSSSLHRLEAPILSFISGSFAAWLPTSRWGTAAKPTGFLNIVCRLSGAISKTRAADQDSTATHVAT